MTRKKSGLFRFLWYPVVFKGGINMDTIRELCAPCPDTNGDGEVDISDATHLQMYLAKFKGVVLGKQAEA